MRVCLAILNAEVARGGAERYTRDLAAALVGRGISVTTAAVEFDEGWPGERVALGARAMTRVGSYQRYIQQLDQLVERERFDVVHAMLPVLRCDVYHPHAGIAAETKRWGPMEHFNRRRRAMLLAERDLILGNEPPITLSLSNYVLRRLRSVYPGAPSEVVLNGTDLRKFDPAVVGAGVRESTRQAWGVEEGDFVLLSIAQNFARKGIPVAVEAVAGLNAAPELGGRRVKLVVVGRDDPGPVVALAKGLKAEGQVILPGPVSDPRGCYAGADLFVLPTYHDPCSLVVIESLAMGLPVVSTVFNGSCEWMTDGVHGRVLGEVEARGLAKAVAGYVLDGNALMAARARCLELRPALGVDRHVDRVLEVYEKAMLERVG